MNDVRAAFCRQKGAFYAVWHWVRPVRASRIWKKALPAAHAAAFIRRVYGPAEQAALGLLTKAARRAPLNAHRLASAAANFAAKEAFFKGGRHRPAGAFSLCEIEAVRLESGAPAYHFSGQTAEWMQAAPACRPALLSHEGGMALAFCTLHPGWKRKLLTALCAYNGISPPALHNRRPSLRILSGRRRCAGRIT